MRPSSYESAGVDIEKGDRFANFIAGIESRAVSKAIGGFAGGLEIDLHKYRQPVLLSTTDGVGTKLLVAKKLGVFDSLGIDLVAMCVNDLVVCGAEPQLFLDYIATGSIKLDLLQDLMKGIVRGCELANCLLAGGETAEMPDVYSEGDFDLAGFATGLVEKSAQLPKQDQIHPGDPVYGIPSVGIHSNGLSLARKLIREDDQTWYPELLRPTRIYVREVLRLCKEVQISAAAHITGGGLEGNFSRVLPKGVRAEFTWDWTLPPVFDQISRAGQVEVSEMRRVFNMGIGIAFTLPKSREEDLLDLIGSDPEFGDIVKIGSLVNG